MKRETNEDIKSLKIRKSGGFADITEESIKGCGECIINTFHDIFNKILSEVNVPIDWSEMIINLYIRKEITKSSKLPSLILTAIPVKVFNHVLL